MDKRTGAALIPVSGGAQAAPLPPAGLLKTTRELWDTYWTDSVSGLIQPGEALARRYFLYSVERFPQAFGHADAMTNEERIRTTYEQLVQAAELDGQAPRQPVDERIAFPREQLDGAWRLLERPADREQAMAVCEQLLREAIDQLDIRRGLAALKLVEKLEVAGVRRVYHEGEHGMQQLT